MPTSSFIASLIKEAEQSKDPQKIKMARQLAAKLGQIPDTTAGIGNVLQNVATSSNDGNNNVGLAAAGSGLQGFGQGLNLGVLPALGLGLVSAASGLQNAAQTNADFFDDQALSEKFKLSSKTVSPNLGSFGKGGMIIGDQEFIPVQMEDEELYVKGDLSILDSKADKKHEDMDDKDITDIVNPGSFALSNRLDFNPADYADEKLGYGFAYYNEDDDFELEEVKMSDIYKDLDEPISFSKGGEMIRKHFKTIDEDDKNVDLLTKITNEENKIARRPYLTRLIQIHEGQTETQDSPIIPQKFGKGGKMKKYNGGGFITGLPIGGHSKVGPNGERISVDEDGNEMFLDPLDGLFNELDSSFSDFELENQNAFDSTNDQYSRLFGRINNRNAIGAIGDLFSIGTQDTNTSPRLRSTRFADEMFEEVPNSVIDNVASQNIGRVNSLVSNIARSNPRAANNIAPRLFDSALAQTNATQFKLSSENRNQRRGKYRFLNNTDNFNRGERIRAQESTRDAINKKKAGLGTAFNRFLTNRNSTDINEVNIGRANKGQFNKNKLNILSNRLGLGAARSRHDINKSAIDERFQSLNSLVGGDANSGDVILDEQYLDEILNQDIYDFPIGSAS